MEIQYKNNFDIQDKYCCLPPSPPNSTTYTQTHQQTISNTIIPNYDMKNLLPSKNIHIGFRGLFGDFEDYAIRNMYEYSDFYLSNVVYFWHCKSGCNFYSLNDYTNNIVNDAEYNVDNFDFNFDEPNLYCHSCFKNQLEHIQYIHNKYQLEPKTRNQKSILSPTIRFIDDNYRFYGDTLFEEMIGDEITFPIRNPHQLYYKNTSSFLVYRFEKNKDTIEFLKLRKTICKEKILSQLENCEKKHFRDELYFIQKVVATLNTNNQCIIFIERF